MSETNINVASQVQWNSDYFINKNISEVVMSYVNSFQTKQNTKTIQNVAIGIGMIVLADIVKSITLDLIREQKKSVHEGVMMVVKEIKIFPIIGSIFTSFFTSIGSFYAKMCYRKEPPVNDNNKPLIILPSKTFTLENVSQLFLSNVIAYIQKKQSCTYTKTHGDVFDLNKQQVANILTYNNIHILYKDLTIDFQQPIIKNENTNVYALTVINENDALLSMFEEVTELLLSMPKEAFQGGSHHVDFKLYINHIMNNGIAVINHYYYYVGHHFISQASIKSCGKIVGLFLHKYIKQLFKDIKCIRAEVLVAIFYIACYIELKYTPHNAHALYDKLYKMTAHEYFVTSNYKEVILGTTIKDFLAKTKLGKWLEENNDIQKITYTSPKTIEDNNVVKETETNTLSLHVLHSSTLDSELLHKQTKEFLHHIHTLTLCSANQNKINIYTLQIEKTLAKKTTIAPHYEKYLKDKQSLMEENKDIKKERVLELLGGEPDKDVVEEYVQKTVKSDKINERFASFENLYLSRNQDTELFQLLNSFQQDKEKMASLGIPNKLCLMLHGSPGTGKTTTIITIASYFGKDVFYVSLRNCSNEDLKMMFDFIQEKHSNSGIIIFEDFDAMTSVVKKRQHIKDSKNVDSEYSMVDIVQKKEKNNGEEEKDTSCLTLDYFLNLLDGTLTRDGSIIIMTTNHLEHIDPAIYRAGRADAILKLIKCDHYQIAKTFARFMERDIEPSVLRRIKEYTYAPAEIIFHLKSQFKCKHKTDEEIMQPFLK